jgi:hypothetical protein
VTSWLLEFVKGCAPLNIKKRIRNMVRKAKCEKCVNCIYVNKESYNIGCRVLGDCREKYMCEHYMTELEYKTALESLKLIEESKKYGRN